MDAIQFTLSVLFIMPVAFIIFAVWHVRKLNSINQTILDILEKLKND